MSETRLKKVPSGRHLGERRVVHGTGVIGAGGVLQGAVLGFVAHLPVLLHAAAAESIERAKEQRGALYKRGF